MEHRQGLNLTNDLDAKQLVNGTAYTLLVGAGAAVVRAALMGGLSFFARQD